jgi:O-antigen/teichoic acid export membrane protein
MHKIGQIRPSPQHRPRKSRGYSYVLSRRALLCDHAGNTDLTSTFDNSIEDAEAAKSEQISSPADKRRRSRRIFQAGISAVFCKGLVLLVNAISLPLTVRYLGAEQFGIWVTISTTVALLVLLDFGIASSMTNLISEAYALDDKDLASRYASTGFWIMVLIALVLGAAGAAVWPLVHWNELFHVTGAANEQLISHTVAAAFAVFLAGLPAGLAAKFLAGYQEIKTANIFSAIGALASLAAVFVVTKLHGNMVMLIIGSSGAIVGTNIGCLAWLWLHHKPWLAPAFRHCRRGLVRRMMQSGSEFFILQLTGIIVFNSDNFVITHFLGPAQVTPYSVTWKLVGYSALLQIVITPALWPAYAEAYVRKDFQWIRRTLYYVMLATMGVAGVCCAAFVIWGQSLIRLWAGSAAVPTETLLVLMSIWILISTFMANTATVLAATNETKLQAWLSAFAAALNLAASIWLVKRIGPSGVILSTIGSYVLVLVGPQTWKVMQVVGRSSTPSKLAVLDPASESAS